jgi:predicted cobalt transporter CbtA
MAVFLRLLGEGPIGDAVAFESHHEAVHDELYTRATQQVGGMLGVLLYGIAMGVMLAVVLAAVRHKLPLRDDWSRSITLAAIGFATVVLVPFLKYPANPPTVGNTATITDAMLLFSLAATVLTWRFAAAVATRWGRRAAVPATALLYTVVMGVAFAAFPPFTDKVDLSATLLWRFRLRALCGQVALWSVLGLALGTLLQHREGVDA